MVLEDITNATRSNSRTQRRTSTSRATTLSLLPTHRSTLGRESETDESRACSAATLLRRRSRLSYELIRRLSTEIQKRRRESLSVIDSSASVRDKRQRRSSITKRPSLFEFLNEAENTEHQFPKGYSIEYCNSMRDRRLVELHIQYQETDQSIGTLDGLIKEYGDDLKAALVKFLDTEVGYLLYIQLPSHPGVTSRKPLDCLLVLWVNSTHQDRGVEKSMLHWWIKTVVRTIKYFTVQSAAFDLMQLLQKEGFKAPEPCNTERRNNYIAQMQCS